MERNPATFREYAGTLAAFILVMAYAAIGFVLIAVSVTTGTMPSVPADWNASMLTLAGGALGFLVGKQTSQPTNQQPAQPPVVPPLPPGA
jgi:hypothetical protein